MGCNRCGAVGKCGCACTSVPYYIQAETCPEDHCEKIYVSQFSFSVCPTVSWNVPSCGQTALLSVPGLQGASVGSFIWNVNYGYFEITSIDAEKGLLGIANNCTTGNSSPGTQIPACTCFVVTTPPLDITASTQVCVEIDFTAPAEDVPLDITVTNTSGLTPSDTIQIGTGFYFLEAIKPNNIITIINKGQGIAPGTPVIAKSNTGQYQYCISIISTNACDREETSSGRLLACNSDGVTVPLGEPCAAGYIPVAVDDCNVEMQPAITPPICMHLTSAASLVNGTANYTFVVDDSTGLLTTDILTISGMPSTRADVTAVTDSTHINVTLSPTPGANSILSIGTLICTIDCCEELGNEIDDINNDLELQNTVQVSSVAVTPGTFNTVTTVLGNIANAGPYINNRTQTLKYVATFEYVWAGQMDADPDAFSEFILSYLPQYASVVGATGTTVAPAPVTDVTVPLATSFIDMLLDQTSRFLWNYGQAYTHQIVGTIPPGNELRLSARAVQGALHLSGTLGVNYTNINCKITTVLITS